MEENITEVITPEAPQDIPAQTAPVAEPVAQPAASDCQEPAGYPQEEPVSPKPKKKLNKKVLIIGIAAILVVALAVCLVSLLGGGTKNTGVFIKDGELYLYVEGKKEPVELTSRLWKGAENNTLVSMGGVLTNLVTIRNNGQLVFYPDKFENNSDGYTIYVANVNKPKEDPVKIDNSIATYYVSEDGQQVLYAKYNKTYSLHLYDVKNEEETRLAKDIQMFHHFTYAEDLSSVCYLSDEDLYLWTPDSEDVRIAKDVSAFQYLPETGIVFAKTADGELLMKTAQMEECEEVAEDVSTLLGVYASGEAYYLRKSIVERCLLDYLDDDMKTEDAAIAQPKKPNYPSAPKRIYYWNYATDEEYQKAKEQYDIDYAAYLEQYNAMKEEYDKAMELYNLKQERDAIRENLEARTIEYEEYALYYYDGSEEHLISDSLVSGSFKARSRDAAVTVYAPDKEIYALLDEFRAELPTVFIVSQVSLENTVAPEGVVVEEGSPIGVAVSAAAGEKCDRCWNYTTEGAVVEDGCLCPRCRRVLGV